MKQFLHIFCLYLFVLSCVPCNDGEHGHGISNGGETIIKQDDKNLPTHEHCADLCPPFCTCSCCGCIGSSEKVALFEFHPPIFTLKSVGFIYQSPSSAAHFEAPFRPPIGNLG